VGVHGDQEDSGHQDEEEEDPPHPSAGHATHHSGVSASKQKKRKSAGINSGRDRERFAGSAEVCRIAMLFHH